MITTELRAAIGGTQPYQLEDLKVAHDYLNVCRHGSVVDHWPRPAGGAGAAAYGGFDNGCVPFIDRNTYSNYDLLSSMQENVDKDMEDGMEENMKENVEENMEENMDQATNEASPVRPAEHVQQPASSEQSDKSLEQP